MRRWCVAAIATAVTRALCGAALPLSFASRSSVDTLRDDSTQSQRLSPIRTDPDSRLLDARVRLMIAASQGTLSTSAQSISSKISAIACDDDTTSVLDMASASLADVEHVLETLWFTPVQPSSSTSRCGDRAFRPPRVDVWLQATNHQAPQLSCTDLPPANGLQDASSMHHHVKRVILRPPPAYIYSSMNKLVARRSEEATLTGLALRVPGEDMQCASFNDRQRLRLRIHTTPERDGQVVLRPAIRQFLSPYLPAPNGSRVIHVEAPSEYIRLALRSVLYLPPRIHVDDEIAIELWTIGAGKDEGYQSIRLGVAVMYDAAPAMVMWNQGSINSSFLVEIDEDSVLQLSKLTIDLPFGSGFEDLILNATLAVSHGHFEFHSDDLSGSIVTRRGVDDSVFQISGTSDHLNRCVQRMVYKPNVNYNGPDTIVVSVIQNTSSHGSDSMIQPLSNLLQVFILSVHDDIKLAWADSNSNTSYVTIPSSTRRRIPPTLIIDGEEEGDDEPFFSHQSFLRAEVETASLGGASLYHPALQPARVFRDNQEIIRLTADGSASSLMAILSRIEIVSSSPSLYRDTRDTQVLLRMTRVNNEDGATSSNVEALLIVTIEKEPTSYLSQLLLRRQKSVLEDEQMDLGDLFASDGLATNQGVDFAGTGIIVSIAVRHGQLSSNATSELAMLRKNLTLRGGSIEQLINQLKQLTYAPDKDFTGDDDLTLSTEDDSTTLKLHVVPVNDPPSLVVDSDENATTIYSLRRYLPRIVVEDPDAGDWLTLALTATNNHTFIVANVTGALSSGVVFQGIDFSSWTIGTSITAQSLRVQGTSGSINQFFSHSSVVEISPPEAPDMDDQECAVQICVSDTANLSDCVSQSVRFTPIHSFVRFSAEIPSVPFRKALPATFFVDIKRSNLSAEAVIALRFSARFGAFLTKQSANFSQSCGQSWERQSDSDGTLRIYREISGRWECVLELLHQTFYQGASTLQDDEITIELRNSARRLLYRSFSLEILPPKPRIQIKSRATNDNREVVSKLPVWSLIQGKPTDLAQFVEISIENVESEEAGSTTEQATEDQNRVLELNIMCTTGCLLNYKLDSDALVPGIDYSYARRDPSPRLQFFGTRHALSVLLSSLQIRPLDTSLRAADGNVEITVTETVDDLFPTAVAMHRIAFRFQVVERQIEWRVEQDSVTSSIGAGTVPIDGVSLVFDGLDPSQSVRVRITCEEVATVAITVNHPAVRLTDHVCGSFGAGEAIEIVDSLLTMNEILSRIQVVRRDALPRNGDTVAVRFEANKDFDEHSTSPVSVVLRVRFQPAVGSSQSLVRRLTAAREATLAVDEDAELHLGDVFNLQDADHGDNHLYRMSARVSHGSLEIPLDDVCCIQVISSARGPNLIFKGILSSLRDALAKVKYQPRSEFSGKDLLQIAVDDTNRDVDGWTHDTAIHVRPANDAPRIMLQQKLATQHQWSIDTTLDLTELSVHVYDADIESLRASANGDNLQRDPSLVRVRLTVYSAKAFMVIPRLNSVSDSLDTLSLIPDARYRNGTREGLPMRTISFVAPIATANDLLENVLYFTSDSINGSGTAQDEDVDQASIEVNVNDLAHGVDEWEAAETTEWLHIDSMMAETLEGGLSLSLPSQHTSVDEFQRKVTITGLSLAKLDEADSDDDDEDAIVRITGSAAFRVVPEVQRVELVGPERVQILSVLLQTPGGVDATSVTGTFGLKLTQPTTNQQITVTIYAQAVAMRVDEVMGNAGTGLGLSESMQAMLESGWIATTIHVVKTVDTNVIAWRIYTTIPPGGSLLIPPQVAGTTFTGVGAGGVATVSVTSDVAATSLGGSFMLKIGAETTRKISATATDLDVQDAIEELPSISTVLVTNVRPYAWDITFLRPGANIPLLEVDVTILTPIATTADAAWPMLTTVAARAQVTRIIQGFGQGALYEVDIGGTLVSPVYNVTVSRTISTIGGGSFTLSFLSGISGGVVATTDAIAYDAVATASDEAVLTQEGGRVDNSMEAKLRGAIRTLPRRHWSSATRVAVSRVSTASPPSNTWTITFVDAPADFPSLVAAASSAQPAEARLSVTVSVVTASNTIGGSFTLSYRNLATVRLPVSASAVALEENLNGLDTVRNASTTFGRVVVRRKELRSVGGASFAVLFVEEMTAPGPAAMRLIADGGELTGLGAFARVRSFHESFLQTGVWMFPGLLSLPRGDPHRVVSTRGVQASLAPNQFELQGAAADVRVWLQQLVYAIPTDWCCGFISVIFRADSVDASSDAVVIQTEEERLAFQAQSSVSISHPFLSTDMVVTRGLQHDITFLSLEIPTRSRDLLWLHVRVSVSFGTLQAKSREEAPTATDEVWLNGTAVVINSLLATLQYSSTRASIHDVDVLSIVVLDGMDNTRITQSEYLLRMKEPPFEPRIKTSMEVISASDDAPVEVSGISIVDANSLAGFAPSIQPHQTVVDVQLRTEMGRLSFKRTDGIVVESLQEDTALKLRGDVLAINDAFRTLQYESSPVYSHTRDTITLEVSFKPDSRPLLIDTRVVRIDVSHAVHIPRVRIGSSNGVTFAGREDNGFLFPGLTFTTAASNTISYATGPQVRPRRVAVTELTRTDLQPPKVTTLIAVGTEDDPRHRWIADFPGLSTAATSSRSFASFTTGNNFFFTGTDRTYGEELWTSDGSPNGTTLLVDLFPGNASSSPGEFAVLPPNNNRLLFAADGIDRSWLLNTEKLCNRARPSSTAKDTMYVVSASATWDPTASYECPRPGWRWATTSDASARFQSPTTSMNLSEPYVFWNTCDWDGYVFGGTTRRYFRFADSAVTGALKHAGRRDSAPVEVSFSTTDFAGIVCVRDNNYAGSGSAAGRELWITDGSTAFGATKRLKDIDPGPRSSKPKFLTPFQSRWVVFQATTAELGTELYKTDGTTGGTVLVEDIWRGPRSSNPSDFTEWSGGDGRLYFAATTEAGRELWSTDGLSSSTVERSRRQASTTGVLIGTSLVRDICVGGSSASASSHPQFLTPLGTIGVFFAATDCINGRELWVTDGTLAGTKMVKDINPASGEGSDPSHLVAFNGKLYFAATANDASMGRELFVSDGTTAGTQLLVEFLPGVVSASPSLLTVANAQLYFHALDAHGVGSLWVSDGTLSGTVPVWDAPFAQSHILRVSSPSRASSSGLNDKLFTTSNGLYYFVQRIGSSPRDEDDNSNDDVFQLQVSVDHGTISIPPERSASSSSQIVSGTQRQLQDVLKRTLYHPSLNWNLLQSPEDHVVQWNFTVSSLSSPSLTAQITIADLIVCPQIDPPVIGVPFAVEDATASAADYLSRLRLQSLPITVLEDVPTPLRGFSVRGMDDLDGVASWELELSVSRGRLSLPTSATGCIRMVTLGRTADTKRVKLTAARVACLSRLLAGLSYVSDPNGSGSDALTIRVTVSIGISTKVTAQDVAIVPILVTEVNDAPFLTSQSGFFYDADEDRALIIQDLQVIDPDADSNQRVRVDVRVNYGAISILYHGADTSRTSIVVETNETAVWAPTASTRLVLSGLLRDVNAVLASVAYTSGHHWNSLAHTDENEGYDVVTVDLSDDQAFNTSTRAKLFVFVMPTPDPIQITIPRVHTTSPYAALSNDGVLHGDEDEWLEIAALAFTSDDDTSRLSLDISLRVSHGRLAMDESVLRSGGVTTSDSRDDGSFWRLRGRLALVNRSVATLRYLPARDYNGADALEITATAMDDYVNQQSIETTRVVPITIHDVNDPPQWILPTSRVAWKQDDSTRISGVELRDVDTESIDCAVGGVACTWEVVVQATGSGTITLPRLRDVPRFSSALTTSLATNYVVLTGSLAELNLALGDIVLTTADTVSLVQEPVEIWFTADDRGTSGSGGPQITRQQLVVTPFEWTQHALELITPQDQVLTVDEDTPLKFDGSIRLQDRDSSTRSIARAPQYEVAIESSHGRFELASPSLSASRLQILSTPSSSDRILRFRGFLAQINTALNGSSFVPDQNWFGSEQLRFHVKQVSEGNHGQEDATTASVFVFVSPVCDPPRWRSIRSPFVSDLQADMFLDEDGQVLVKSLALEDPDVLENEQEVDSTFHRDLSVAIDVHDDGGVILATTTGLRITEEQSPMTWPPPFKAQRLLFFSHVVLTGRVGDLNSAMRGLIYRPRPDFHTNNHVRDAITVRTFDPSGMCPSGDGSELTLRALIVAVNDAPSVMSSRFRQVTSGDVALDVLHIGAMPTQQAFADQELVLDPITVKDVDLDITDEFQAAMEPTMRLRISCRSCTVRTTLSLETLQQAHGVLASQEDSGRSVWSVATTYYGPISAVNGAVLSSLVFKGASSAVGAAVVLLEVSDLGFSGRGGPRETAFAMVVRVVQVNDGPTILVPPYGTRAPPLQLDEFSSVLLQGAPPVPPSAGHDDTNTSSVPVWQLQSVDPRGVDSHLRLRSLLDVASLDAGGAMSSYALLSPPQLVFSAFNAASGSELWINDGTSGGVGTRLLKDLAPGARSSNPRYLTRYSVDGRVYFAANGRNTDDWRLRRDRRDACDGFRESAFAPGVFFAVAQSTTWEAEETYDCPTGFRWMTTAEANALFVGTVPRDGHADEPLVYFDQCGWDGYEWGGQQRTHFRFADSKTTGAFKHAGHRDSYRPDVGFAALQFAGIVCRRLQDDERGGEETVDGEALWSTDGTSEGTRRVTRSVSRPAFFAEFRGRLFFQATTADYGAELWASDGTRAGTQLIADVSMGTKSSSPEQLTVASGKLFFSATTEAYGRELWVSDGEPRREFAQVNHAATATRLVLDIRTGATSSHPRFLAALPAAGVVLFQADDGVRGTELWKSDGSAAGTTLVADLRPGPRGSSPRFLTLFNGRVFFQADDGVRGAELWVSDGSTFGTQLLVDLVAGARGSGPRYLSVLAMPSVMNGINLLVFAAATDRDPQVVEFWTSDGSSGGTQRLFAGSREPTVLNTAAMDTIHDGRARLLPLAGGFVVFGRRFDPLASSSQSGSASRTRPLVAIARSLTLVDDDTDDDRRYNLSLQSQWGVLSLPNRHTCGISLDDSNTTLIMLRGSLAQLNCMVAQVAYAATQRPPNTQAVDGWDDAIVVTLSEEATTADDDGRAYETTQRVPVRVVTMNHAPLIELPARVVAAVDVWTPVSFIGVSDEDAGDTATLLLRVAASRGRVRLVDVDRLPPTVVLLSAQDPRGAAMLEVAASLEGLNALLAGRLQYACLRVDGCAAGDDDVLAVTVDDNGFTGRGGAQSATQSTPVVVVGEEHE